MNDRDEVFIKHILDSIGLIEGYVAGKSASNFRSETALQDMVFRRLEIIGEAVKNISPAFRKKHPEVPWKQIAGLRDKLIHHYFGVDLELTWAVVEKNLPELRKALKSL